MELEDYNNPWAINALEELLYFCCPECEVRDQSEELFIQHAIESHPRSKAFLLPFKVKLEYKESISYSNSDDFDYDTDNIGDEMVKRELYESDCPVPSSALVKVEYDDSGMPEESDEIIENYSQVESSSDLKRESKKTKIRKKKVKSNDTEKKAHISRNYSCFDAECDFQTNAQSKLLEHLEVVHKTLESGTCLKCNKVISKAGSKSYIYNHMESCYNSAVNSCHKCGKQFSQKFSLIIHLKNVHSEETFECKECKKVFKNLNTFTNHQVIHDKDRRRYQCHLCSNDYGTKNALEVHVMKAHEGKKDLFKTKQCNFCGKKFESNAKLAEHVDMKHNEDYKGVDCDLCNKNYVNQTSLEKHKRLVHFKERNFVCEICAKSFQTRPYLKHHIESVHGGLKKYKCKLCDKAFAQVFGLKRHMDSFHEGKRYHCTKCVRSFTQEYHLKQHIETSHN